MLIRSTVVALTAAASFAAITVPAPAVQACSVAPPGWQPAPLTAPAEAVPIDGVVPVVLTGYEVNHETLQFLTFTVTDVEGTLIPGAARYVSDVGRYGDRILAVWEPDEDLGAPGLYTLQVQADDPYDSGVNAWTETMEFTTATPVTSALLAPTVDTVALEAQESRGGEKVCCAIMPYRDSCLPEPTEEDCFFREWEYLGRLSFDASLADAGSGQVVLVVDDNGTERVFLPGELDGLAFTQGKLSETLEFCVNVSTRRLSDGVTSDPVPVCVAADDVADYETKTGLYWSSQCLDDAPVPTDPTDPVDPTDPTDPTDPQTPGTPEADPGEGCQGGQQGLPLMPVAAVLGLLFVVARRRVRDVTA